MIGSNASGNTADALTQLYSSTSPSALSSSGSNPFSSGSAQSFSTNGAALQSLVQALTAVLEQLVQLQSGGSNTGSTSSAGLSEDGQSSGRSANGGCPDGQTPSVSNNFRGFQGGGSASQNNAGVQAFGGSGSGARGDAGAQAGGGSGAAARGDAGAQAYSGSGSAARGDAGAQAFGGSGSSSRGDAGAQAGGGSGSAARGDASAQAFGGSGSAARGDAGAQAFGGSGSSSRGDAGAQAGGANRGAQSQQDAANSQGSQGTPGAQGSKGGAQGVVNGADRVADTPAFSRSDATGGSGAPGARGANGGAQGVVNGADRVADTPAFSRTTSSGPMGTGQAADPNAPIVNAPAEQVYSFDGSGNNIRNSELGAAGQEFIRIIPTATSDRLNDADLPSAREVSNVVMSELGDTPNAKGASDMLWQWGQFLDHDITATEADKDNKAPISVPKGDVHFDPFGTGQQTIDFTRSEAHENADGERNQINEITTFLDGSNVYGSDQATADRLRSFEGGQMRVDAYNNLPKEAGPSSEPAARGKTLYDAGDARNSEQPGLTSVHTLFVREHNRIAEQLSTQNPDWSDEQVFQAARSQNIAQMQAVTYNEFLPMLLGEDAISDYSGYKPGVDPSISNSFATSAYRFGHSAIPSNIPVDANGGEIFVASGRPGNVGAAGASGAGGSTGGGSVDGIGLRDSFFNPDIIEQNGIDPFLRGLTQNVHQELDNQINDDLRNFLFGPPGAGGLDLAAANIQRGRDHDLPGYNDAREAMGLGRIDSFDDPVFRDGVGDKLAQVYDHPDDIDMWVGGLSEQPTGNAMVGELNNAIMVDQFTRLRDGDRLWYENTMTPDQIRQVNETSLSDIIKRNTDVQNIDDTAFNAID